MTQPVRGAGWWLRGAIALGALILSLTWFAPVWRSLAAPRPEIEHISDENFANGATEPAASLDPGAGFVSPDGWCVRQRTASSAVYRLTPRETGVLSRIAAWFYLPEGGGNLIELSLDGGRTFVPLARNTHHAGSGLSIPEELQRPAAALALRFTVENPSPDQFLGLDKLVLVFADGVTPPVAARGELLLAFLVAGAGIAVLWPNPAAALVSLLILAAGVSLRYDALRLALDRPLDPDAQVYRLMAMRMDLFSSDLGFYSASFNEREPVFVLASHAFFGLTDGSQFHLRLLTVVLSVCLIWVAMRLSRSVAGPIAGWAIGILVALNGPLVAESVRGLRLEAETIVWLAWLGLAFVWRAPKGWGAPVALGMLGGGLLLLRSSYMPVLVLLAILAAWQRGGTLWRRAASAALTIALMAALVAPHRLSMYERRGDAFWDTTMYARWLANFEFAGQPGYPSIEALQVDGYQGPAITYGEYLFGLHTPAELVTGTARGYGKILRHMDGALAPEGPASARVSAGLRVAVPVLGIIGMLLALFTPRHRWLPISFVLVLGPAAFLFDRALLEHYRHTYQAFPLLLLAAALAVRDPIDRVRAHRSAPSRVALPGEAL